MFFKPLQRDDLGPTGKWGYGRLSKIGDKGVVKLRYVLEQIGARLAGHPIETWKLSLPHVQSLRKAELLPGKTGLDLRATQLFARSNPQFP